MTATTKNKLASSKPHAAGRKTSGPAKNASRAPGITQPTYVFDKGGQRVELVGRSVFEDLGFTPEESHSLLSDVVDEILRQRNSVKETLVSALEEEIETQGLSIKQAAEIVAISRPRMSNFLNRNFEKVSVDALIDAMHKFGKEVRLEVVKAVKPRRSTVARQQRAVAAQSNKPSR